MPWWGWLLVALGAFLALAAITFRLLRMSRRGRRFLSLSTRGKLAFGHALLSDPDVPITAKIALIVLVGYLAMPFDLIPDFIPVIGQLDDALVIFVAIGLLIVAVPRAQFEAALRQSEQEDERRRSERARELPG